MVRIAWLGWWLAPVLVARAEIYRCTSDGQVTYTDRACAAGAPTATLPPIGLMPGMKGPDLAKQYDERVKREHDAHARENQAWLKAHAAQKEEEREAEAARQAERVARRRASRELHPAGRGADAPASELKPSGSVR